MSLLLVTDKDFKDLVYSESGYLKAPWLEHNGHGTIAESVLLPRNSFLEKLVMTFSLSTTT